MAIDMSSFIAADEAQVLADLAVALAIGLLFGLERGWHGEQEINTKRSAGVRTFGLIGLLGGVSGVLSSSLPPIAFGLMFAALTAAAVSSFVLNVRATGDSGSTTLIAELLAFALAALSTLGHQTAAASAAVVATLLLGFKPQLHRWLAYIDQAEMQATLKLLLISVVLLPVLPNHGYGPADALNPYELWWLVVLIAAISYAGYFAVKVFGSSAGFVLTGLLAGLASSTALTLQMARTAREHQQQLNLIAASILIANATLFPRILVVVALLKPALAIALAPMLAVMTLLLSLPSLLFWLGRGRAIRTNALQVQNPLALWQALRFGLLLAAVMLVARVSEDAFGSVGLLGVATVSGIADMNAITLSVAKMDLAALGSQTAVLAILLALMSNGLFKTLLCGAIGGLRLAWRIGLPLGMALVAGLGIVVLDPDWTEWLEQLPLTSWP